MFNVYVKAESGGYRLLKMRTAPQWHMTNAMWQFGSIEQPRSTTFKVPRIAENDKVFGLAGEVWHTTTDSREGYDALVFFGSKTTRARLYIVGVSATEYEVVAVEQSPLSLLADLEWADIYGTSTANVQLNESVQDADNTATQVWANARYYNDLGKVLPSIGVSTALSAAFSHVGLSFSLPTEQQGLRLVLPKVNYPKDRGVVLQKPNKTTFSTAAYRGTLLTNLFVPRVVTMRFYDNVYGSPQQYTDTQVAVLFSVYGKTKIRFPKNFPTDVFMVALEYQLDEGFYTGGTTLGDYGFDMETYEHQSQGIERAVYGKPLSGREVEMEAGQAVIFVKKWQYINENFTDEEGHFGRRFGWVDGDCSPYDFGVVDVAVTEEVNYNGGKTLWLRDNLPSVKPLELIKQLCLMFGLYIKTEGTSVTLAPIDRAFNNVSASELRLLSWDNVRRSVFDFAQENKIYTADNATVAEYHVNNAYLAHEKTLATLSWVLQATEGNVVIRNLLRYTDSDGSEVIEPTTDIPTLAVIVSGEPLLQAVVGDGIATLGDICDLSTCVNLHVSIESTAVANLQPHSVFRVRGKRWTWSELTYEDASAKAAITLQMID